MKRGSIRPDAENKQSKRRMNLLHELVLMVLFATTGANPGAELATTKTSSRKTCDPGFDVRGETEEHVLRCRFNEDVDLAGAPETLPCIESHGPGLASP